MSRLTQRAAPVCEVCDSPMLLRRIYPRTWVLPEVHAYECESCGNARSIEFEPTPPRREAAAARQPRMH